MKKILSLSLALASMAAPAIAQEVASAAAVVTPPAPDTGNTTWLLLCSALVMLMTPGLAFFYAGMVNSKNVVSTLLQNYVALAIVGLIWVIAGYSLAFSEGSAYIGGMDFFMLRGLSNTLYSEATGVPHYAFMAFQMMFAVITPALITGAIAERVNFKAWMLLMALWSLAVYVPVAHWVWGPGGWIMNDGGLDFAGGLVVHITAGVAGLVAALMFGKRNNEAVSHPYDVSMVMLGAALLWFGWFGFNAGSAITSGFLSAHAFVTTYVGASAAFISWMMTDWIKTGKPSALGASIGLVVGLVVITPAAGFVSVENAIIMCAIAGVVCNLFARVLKSKTRLDDALDVFACHGMGGILGAIMTGMFAETSINSAVTTQGLLISGETGLFIANLTAVIAVTAFTAIVTYILIKIVNVITPIRVSEEHEDAGLDASVHGEKTRSHDRSH